MGQVSKATLLPCVVVATLHCGLKGLRRRLLVKGDGLTYYYVAPSAVDGLSPKLTVILWGGCSRPVVVVVGLVVVVLTAGNRGGR